MEVPASPSTLSTSVAFEELNSSAPASGTFPNHLIRNNGGPVHDGTTASSRDLGSSSSGHRYYSSESTTFEGDQHDLDTDRNDDNNELYDGAASTEGAELAELSCPLLLEPLSVGGMVLRCDDHNPCPPDHFCSMPVPLDGSSVAPFCCPMPRQIESTKPGKCPFLGGADEGLCAATTVCSSDDHCRGAQKCCVVPVCGGPVCVEGDGQNYTSLDQGLLLQGPTMCEYLRDLAELEGVELAVATPSCDDNGAYELVQCNDLGQCWCVDDYGSYIPGTKVSSRSLVTCSRLRESLDCGDVLCRLGCDYGFVLDPDTACPLCMCRDPCEGVDCGSGLVCELVDIPCVDGICPPIPQCVPLPQLGGQEPSCPRGEPYIITGSNDTLSCSPRARALECPRGYTCLAQENDVEGVCCSAAGTPQGKLGQCPYLVPAVSQACDLECSTDAHCQGDEKCCSNGCGMHCVQPIIKTACQHQRTLLEHRAREAGIPAGRVYLPQCDEQGQFESTQCHPATTTCWCVDPHGLEVPGTRLSQPARPNCQAPLQCPPVPCDLACLHGRALDDRGCPTCSCRDPCEEVRCNAPLEECRIVHVACVGDPCPPLPVCLPKLDNPCPTGSPLTINSSVVQCGPEGSVCPSSHKCHLSPLGEYALCCRKPREVCYEPRDSGFCEGSIRRWRFDPESNKCKSFRFGGCGGNLNNFESEVECNNACPVLSSCEKMRAKNLLKAEKNNRMTFIPKCQKDTGAWLPQQCLEELGVCWCVTPEGDQVEGSLTRGATDCGGQASGRMARRLDLSSADLTRPSNAICESGQTVHVCPKSVCRNKVCLAHPGATCRTNPCGGCSAQFVDQFNSVVDCNEGLSPCQTHLQAVLNAHVGAQHDSITDDADHSFVLYDLSNNADVYHSAAPAQHLNLRAGSLSDSPAADEQHLQREEEAARLQTPTQPLLDSLQAAAPVSFFAAAPRSAMQGVGSVDRRRSRQLAGVGELRVVEEGEEQQRSRRSLSEDSLVSPAEGHAMEQLVPPMDGEFDDSLASFVPRPPQQQQQTVLEEEEPLPLDYEAQELAPKLGTCPSPASDVSLLTCEPRQECLQDSHCEGSAKCCFTGCGSACLQPREVPASSQGMSLTAPVCERDGSYARTQTAQGWSWCVDSRGRPLHHTLTRGHVRCGPNGQVLEQVSQGDVCPSRPGVTARVCRDECLTASCAAHPDALCVADPCNGCRVSFYSGSGEKVHCEERCSQPLAPGMCRAAFKRFHHNASSGRCEEFMYGGCQGNDNNFATLEECQQHCQLDKSPCSQPLRPGQCGGEGVPRWYYSAEGCQPFLYSGCDGNSNNFLSKLHCEATCPELVLCPLWSSSSMEPLPCSRLEACRNQSCLGYPDAVCTVDPCSCRPYFVDQRGQSIQCQQPTQPPRTILAFSYDQDLPDDLSVEELSGTEGPVTIYLEGEPSLGRCELLRRHLAGQQGPPHRYHPQCDERGDFLPTQCYTGVYVHDWSRSSSPSLLTAEQRQVRGGVVPRCWCVDETGKKTHPSGHFLRGQRECEHVLVESVVVTLGFHGHKLGLDALGRRHEKEIREQMADVLASLRPASVDGKVAIVDLPDVTQVKFTLRGDKKIDAAYKLEDQVRKGELALLLSSPDSPRRVPADMRASWFHHQVAPPAWRSSGGAAGGDLAAAREIVSQMETAEPPFLAATVVITVVSAALLCGLVVAVVLYRRHVAGNYPKAAHGSMQSLAFSDTSLDRRSISSGKFCAQLEHPKLDGKLPAVTTIENEFRAVTRH